MEISLEHKNKTLCSATKPSRKEYIVKGYKVFGKGMICRGKRYSENTVFEEEKAEVCMSGMHFCKNPLDVLDYYPLVNENRKD